LLFVKGAPEELLPRARWIDIDGRREPLSAECVDVVVQAATAMADRGLRVLAFAYRVLPTDYALAEAEADLVVTALAGFEDPPRPEVPDAVRRCQTAGIRIIMVTGDHPRTALAVARKIGLVRSPDPRLLTGAALGRMSDTEILFALDASELVCARVTADQKLRVVTLLQRKRYIVAVTGDGVNDAPALRAADIGIAMGRSGTDVAREASDMVLLDDNFASIVEAIEEGRAIYENIRKFLTYVLTSNVPELVPYLAFAFARLPLALTVIQILAVDLGTDMLPALGPGTEPPDRAVMLRPPRNRGDRLLTRGLLVRAYMFLGSLEAAAAMGAFMLVLGGAGWHRGTPLSADDVLYREATTACLTAIVLMQVVNVHLCRSRRKSIFTGPFSGKSTDHRWNRRRAGPHCAHRLHGSRSDALWNSTDRARFLGHDSAVRGRHADPRGAQEGNRSTDAGYRLTCRDVPRHWFSAASARTTTDSRSSRAS
jgi:magnesium-transporting ATPase (P-type)